MAEKKDYIIKVCYNGYDGESTPTTPTNSNKTIDNKCQHTLEIPRLADLAEKAVNLRKAKDNEETNSVKSTISTRKPLDFYSYFPGLTVIKENPTPRPYEPKSFYGHFSFTEIESTKSCQSIANYTEALQKKFKQLELDTIQDDKKEMVEKSSKVKIAKPEMSFLQRYRSMCTAKQLKGIQLFSIVKLKSPYELNIIVDKIRYKEWSLFCDTLKTDTTLKQVYLHSQTSYLTVRHDISSAQICDTMKINTGLANTNYGLKTLLHALGLTLLSNSHLRILELSGLYLTDMYINYLTEALHSSSIIRLSVTNSPLGDKGCLSICSALKQQTSIKQLELNRCGLTAESGVHIAEFLVSKYLHYSSKCWENNLRDSVKEPSDVEGILKLTLNNNPELGNEGIHLILTSLLDNECIKCVEMQSCGITAELEQEIMFTISRNVSLIVADFRNNNLGKSCTETVEDILTKRAPKNSLYRWNPPLAPRCDSLFTLKSYNPRQSNYLHFSSVAPPRCPSKSPARTQTMSKSVSTTLINRRSCSPDRLSKAPSSSLSRHSTACLVSQSKIFNDESINALSIRTPLSSTCRKTRVTKSKEKIQGIQCNDGKGKTSKTRATVKVKNPRDVTPGDVTKVNARKPSSTSVIIKLCRKPGRTNLLDKQPNVVNDEKDSENSTKVDASNNLSTKKKSRKYGYIPKLNEAMTNLKDNATLFTRNPSSHSFSLEKIVEVEGEDADGKSK